MPEKSCDAGDVTVAVLTGHRPDLLRKTLNSLPRWLGETARMVVFHNGGDHDTALELNEFLWDVRVTSRGDKVLPIGEAASELLRHAAVTDTEYTLYLEDDWAFDGPDDCSWLDDARQALQEDLIGLVRLRHTDEPTLTRNMISGESIFWSSWAAPGRAYKVASNAHYTLNPTLMRTKDLPWPAFGENDAQRRFLDVGWWSAQLVPGLFRHIGGENSLRQTVKRLAQKTGS